MPPGRVDRNVLSSNYQEPGQTYLDTKTEAAFEVIAQQIDANAAIFDPGGAALIKSTPITGVSGSDAQAQINDLWAKIQAIQSGVVPAGTITTTMLQDEGVTTAKLAPGAATGNKLGSDVAVKDGTTGKIIGSITGDAATLAGNAPTYYAKKQQENWIAPTLVNGWAYAAGGYATAGYFKDEMGLVHLKGAIKGGANGTVGFTLPVGYRPTELMAFGVIFGNAFGYLEINSSGAVTPIGNTATTTVHLNNISFRAE